MVITTTNKVPTDSKMNIFCQFISFEGLTASWETTIHIKIETMTIMEITSLDISNLPLVQYGYLNITILQQTQTTCPSIIEIIVLRRINTLRVEFQW